MLGITKLFNNFWKRATQSNIYDDRVTDLDICNFYISLSQDKAAGITCIRLKYLVFFAQAWHLALTSKPLFEDKIYASEYQILWYNNWYECISKEHGSFGKLKLGDLPRSTDFNKIRVIDPKTEEILIAVFNVYGWRMLGGLSDYIRNTDPYIEALANKKKNATMAPMSHESLEKYFLTLYMTNALLGD